MSESAKTITSKKFAFLKRFEETLTEDERKELEAYEQQQREIVQQRIERNKKLIKGEIKPKEPIKSMDLNLVKKNFIKIWEHQQNKKLVLNPEEKEFYNAICRYFAKDENLNGESFEFLKGEFDLEKGLLIIGNYGCGKSSLMSAFQTLGKNIYNSTGDLFIWFNSINCNELNSEFHSNRNDKGEILDKGQLFKKYSKGNRYFDDFGTEKQFYGDYLMREILEQRYLDLKWKTYLTTNLSLSEIEDQYGGRVFSRINQMFNVVAMPGEDHRIL